MLKDAEEIGDQQYHGNGLWWKPGYKRKANSAQQCPANHIRRAKIKSAIGIQPFGTMVHLVKNPPKLFVLVHRTMPDIHARFIHQDTGNGTHYHMDIGKVQ